MHGRVGDRFTNRTLPADGDPGAPRRVGSDVDRLLPAGNGGQSAGEPGGGQTFETFKQEAEKSFLALKLREHDWNVSETARALKMPRSNLYKKMERYGLTRESA